MAAGKVDHASATETPTRSAGDFPRLEQLLSRQAATVTHLACDPVKQRIVGESRQIALRQLGSATGIEAHPAQCSTAPAASDAA